MNFLLLNRENNMKNIINKIKAFNANNKGAETAEWGVIVGILVALAVATYGTGGGLGAALAAVVTSITTAI